MSTKQQPILVFGAGGTGCRVAADVRTMVQNNPQLKEFEDKVFLFAGMDTDEEDMRKLNLSSSNIVSLTKGLTRVEDYFNDQYANNSLIKGMEEEKYPGYGMIKF